MNKDYIDLLTDHSSKEPDSITFIKPSDIKLEEFLKNKDFAKESKFVRIEYGLKHKL